MGKLKLTKKTPLMGREEFEDDLSYVQYLSGREIAATSFKKEIIKELNRFLQKKPEAKEHYTGCYPEYVFGDNLKDKDIKLDDDIELEDDFVH